MKCPRCSGADYRNIAAGLRECTSRVLADVVPPGMGGNATAAGIPLYRTCGYRYQVAPASAVPACTCGLYSIAACTKCGEPLCGNHALSASGSVLCARHHSEVQAELEVSRQEEERRRQTEHRSAMARREALAREVSDQVVASLPPLQEEGLGLANLPATLEMAVPGKRGQVVVGRRRFGRPLVVHGWQLQHCYLEYVHANHKVELDRSYGTLCDLLIAQDGRAFSQRNVTDPDHQWAELPRLRQKAANNAPTAVVGEALAAVGPPGPPQARKKDDEVLRWHIVIQIALWRGFDADAVREAWRAIGADPGTTEPRERDYEELLRGYSGLGASEVARTAVSLQMLGLKPEAIVEATRR